MATTGKKGKKQKGKTLVLSEFLAEDHGGLAGQAVVMAPSKSSWADEMAEEEQIYKEKLLLPTAPRAARGADVDESKIPNNAPYTAYIANLPYDIEVEDVSKFFHGLQVKSVRLPREGGEGGRLRGFGYAEFETRQDLVDALTMNELMIKNRKIRVDIASGTDGEEQTSGGMGRGRGRPPRDESREDRTPSDWRSATREGPPPSREGFRERDRDRDRGDREERVERYAAGFNPREAARGPPPPQERSSFGPRRDGPSSFGRDRDGPSFGRDREGGSSFGRDRDGPSFGRDREGGSSFGRDRDGPSYGRDREGPSYGRDREGPPFSRGERAERGDRGDHGDRHTDKEPPKERPKLSLKPRSVPVEEGAPPVAAAAAAEAAPAAPSGAGSASIFGGAKPVDTAARERAIEERLKEKERERDREPPRGREITRAETKDVRDGSHGSGSGRAAEPRGRDHGDEDRSHESKDGDYQPPAKDREYRAPRDQEREYRAPRDQDREYRAPRDQDREYRAPRDQDREYRAPRDQDREYRASRDQDREYRPPRSNDYRPPRGDHDRGDYRASRDTYRDHRPPPRDQERDYQPPRSNDRDDHRENGHYRGGNRGAGGNSRAPPQRANDRARDGGERPRSREGRSHSPNDGSRMRKLEEPKAPVFENRNKFSFLEDENESDGRDD